MRAAYPLLRRRPDFATIVKAKRLDRVHILHLHIEPQLAQRERSLFAVPDHVPGGENGGIAVYKLGGVAIEDAANIIAVALVAFLPR